MPPAHELTAPSPRVPALSVPRIAVRYRVALAVLALTALTFLLPSAPTYDPWAWIVWGREILHLDLSTVDGPSWKPLPVLLTTPFALFGGLAPGSVAVRRARRRHRRRRHGLPGRAAARRSAGRRSRRGRLRRRSVDAAQLGARQLRGPARGPGAGRGRPPPRRAHAPRLPLRDRRRAAAPRGVALHRPLRAVAVLARSRARASSSSRAFAAAARFSGCCPSCGARATCCAPRIAAHNPARQQRRLRRTTRSREVVRQFGTMLTPALWVGLGALVAMLALRLGSGRRERRAAVGLAAGRRRWVGEVAVMTNDGFSGNARYLIMPGGASPACWPGRASAGWSGPCRRAGSRAGVAVAALSVVAAVAFAAPSVDRLDAVRASVSYQARLTDGLPGAIAQAGGPRSPASAAGRPTPAPFQVPSVAWQLGEHTTLRAARPARPATLPAADARASSLRSKTTSQQPLRRARHREPRRRGGRADVRDLRRLADRGELRMSATAADASRARGRASRGWAPRAWPSACRKSLLVLAFLVGLSLALRTQAIHARFWIDEGLSVGISSHPLSDIPGRPAQGRLAAAVLPAPQAVDERLRQRRGRHARALGRLRDPHRAGRLAGRARAVRRSRGLDRGAAGRDQPVPDLLRAGDEDVRPRRPALDDRDGDASS